MLAAASASLSGCVSLLPKTAPVQLYDFDAAAPADATQAQPAASTVIGEGAVDFDAAASSDRILTRTGSEAAYIAGARWVAPASTLFSEALTRTFDRTPGAAHLARRGGVSGAPLLLTVDVQTFEARYDQGTGAAPVVEVIVRAALVRTSDRSLAAEHTFTTSVRASDNRVGLIVEAFDQAVQKTLADLVAWTSQSAAPQRS
jgi:cholesterol transport system auxiliary component